MLFNSVEFLLFAPAVFILYWFVVGKSLRIQNVVLLGASYFFYGWWSWKFLGLLVLSTLLDYCYGFMVASSHAKRAKFFVWLSVINNLGILCVFKYFNFFAEQFQQAFDTIGINNASFFLNVGLPIGISFYTFHGMSYVFDVYYKKQQAIRSVVDYAVFVSFFPLLVAGPIERATHLLPQIQRERFFNYHQAVEGCRLILWGFFKKVVVADSLAALVSRSFDQYQELGGGELVLGLVAFSFQIYGDFSGYSDIAIGVAKLFGFELLSNFKFPYFSRNLAEFWRRWHISLSSWFKDYLYIPLGGSAGGKWLALRNTVIVFAVSGFWHGASWNFVLWGLVHAFGFIPLLLLNRNRTHLHHGVAYGKRFPAIREMGQMLATFSFVTLAWVFFRAADIHIAFGYLNRILNSLINPMQMLNQVKIDYSVMWIIPLILGDWLMRNDERKLIHIKNPWVRYILYFILTFLVISKLGKETTFIYFQF